MPFRDARIPSSLADFPRKSLRKIRERTPRAHPLLGRAGAAPISHFHAIGIARSSPLPRAGRRPRELDLEFCLRPRVHQSSGNLFRGFHSRRSKEKEYLSAARTFGRRLNEALASDGSGKRRCTRGRRHPHLAIGDGLSVTAVAAQVPSLLPLLEEGARARGWTVGNPFVIRHCRVGILGNEIGRDWPAPNVAVLLIGERPGLATAESLSAYMAYRPGKSHTDANRNLISNIHSRGLPTHRQPRSESINFAAQMMAQRISGFSIREQIQPIIKPPALPK